MKVFLKSASMEHIRQAQAIGILDGLSISFSTAAADSAERKKVARQICNAVDGPVLVETQETESGKMLDEARDLVKLGQNIVLSVPATLNGLAAIKTLSGRGIETAAQIQSPQQALLGAKAGAAYLSLPVGRLEVGGQDSMQVLQDCVSSLRNYELSAQLLATELQSANQFVQAALLGVDAAAIHQTCSFPSSPPRVSTPDHLEPAFEQDEEQQVAQAHGFSPCPLSHNVNYVNFKTRESPRLPTGLHFDTVSESDNLLTASPFDGAQQP